MEPREWTLEELLAEQERLEREAVSEGEELFRARLEKAVEKGAFSDAAPVRKLLSTGIADMERALQTWMERSKTQRGPKHMALRWIAAVGPRQAAYLTLRAVLDGLMEVRVEQAVARRISKLLIDELRFRRLKKAAPESFRHQVREFAKKGTTHYRHRANVLMKTASDAQVDVSDIDMNTNEKIHVGYKLLDVLQHVCGLVESVSATRYNASTRSAERLRLLVPDKQTVQWIGKRTDFLASLSPLTLPTVVPPLEWGPTQTGGYLFALRGRFPLVRRNRQLDQDGTQTPTVYAALNAAQGTAWRINRRVYDLIARLRDGGADVPGYEESELARPATPTVPKPDTNGREESELDAEEQTALEEWREWRRAAARTYSDNKARSQVGRWLESMLSVAQRMRDYPAIYFPHSLDFRGRLYPQTAYLHPQGPDVCRALLEFAEAVPVGEQGRRWIAIHLANTYGETPGGMKVSKMPLDERVQWVEENTDAILACADDPLACDWWRGAEEPWQCLAACLEWAGVVREGVGYASRLPVAMDGSCNGLQHLSAMLRDKRAGAAVNLVPSTLPKDVYTDVAQAASELLGWLLTVGEHHTLTPTQDRLLTLARHHDMGRRWLASGLLGRKLSKRPTMTVAYGSRTFGFKSQIMEWMLKDVDPAIIAEHFTVTDDSGEPKREIGAAAQLMAELLMEAMADAIRGPMLAMDWMQRCADLITKTGNVVDWTVPVTGWRVRQAYYSLEHRRVKTMLAGEIVMPLATEETDKLDSRRQRNGIAPNIVHSLDAACLMLAVVQARNEGVPAFGLIHDSYACHPSYAPVLARAARQAFVRLYSQPVLELLRSQFQEQTKEPLPAVPPQGDLDLGGVLVSDFFFA